MKRKPNFWFLIRKVKPYIIIPYIVAILFWYYSNLNAEQTIMIIIVCVVFYALCIASAGDWVSTKDKHNGRG